MTDATAGVVWLEHPQGRVCIQPHSDGRRLVTTHPAEGVFVSRSTWLTSYPVELIAEILNVKTLGYLCDELARDEDPNYVELFLRYSLLGYLPAESFAGARLLDFGCGSGASTVVLARMLPGTEIVGVELEGELLRLARMRAQLHGLSNLVLAQSPSGERLPPGIGSFQFINLGAVYEHLLPAERRRLPAALWSVLEGGGVIFVNQLPYRFYPIEDHTTGLPLINYLPDRWALALARRYSPRVDADATWSSLLRAGIRGATAGEVRRDLLRGGGQARMLTPKMMGLRDHADLWYGYSTRHQPRHLTLKRGMRVAFKLASRLAGSPVAPGLSLAFQKLA